MTGKSLAGGPQVDPFGYSYDCENRLIGASAGANSIFSAAYDYRTRRVSAVENSAETRYLYDGGDCIQELNTDVFLENPAETIILYSWEYIMEIRPLG
jgi:hypothetical protein